MMNESGLLRKLNDPDWHVRKSAAEHPNATEQVLFEALKNDVPDVRIAGVNNPNATEQVFRLAALDTDERVREAVAPSNKASMVAKIVGVLGE